jgi:hypothetical protein
VGVAARGGPCRDLGDGGHDVVAGRKFDLLQRGALDGGLLRDGCADAGEGDDGQSEQYFPDHDFSSQWQST